MDNTHLRHERTHTAIGRAVTEKLHGGHATTGMRCPFSAANRQSRISARQES